MFESFIDDFKKAFRRVYAEAMPVGRFEAYGLAQVSKSLGITEDFNTTEYLSMDLVETQEKGGYSVICFRKMDRFLQLTPWSIKLDPLLKDCDWRQIYLMYGDLQELNSWKHDVKIFNVYAEYLSAVTEGINEQQAERAMKLYESEAAYKHTKRVDGRSLNITGYQQMIEKKYNIDINLYDNFCATISKFTRGVRDLRNKHGWNSKSIKASLALPGITETAACTGVIKHALIDRLHNKNDFFCMDLHISSKKLKVGNHIYTYVVQEGGVSLAHYTLTSNTDPEKFLYYMEEEVRKLGLWDKQHDIRKKSRPVNVKHYDSDRNDLTKDMH